jgi:hypothetical protein
MYSDVGDLGDEITYAAGVRWYFTPNFAVGGDYNWFVLGDWGLVGEGWLVSLRYDFGSRF